MEHTLDTDDGVTIVALKGDIDVSQAPALRDLLGQVMDGSSTRVLLDLTDVGFLDSSGLGLLVTAHRRAADSGWAFGVAGAGSSVSRVFELTRTTRLLRIFVSRQEGVEALRAL